MSILPSLSTSLGVDAPAAREGKGVVLLVEDDKTIATLLSVLLEREGWKVLATAEGRKAIELFTGSAGCVRLAIIDGRLPDMSGESVCTRLREIQQDLPVLLCSGMNAADSVERVGGLTRFIAKPFSPSQILSDIRYLAEASAEAI